MLSPITAETYKTLAFDAGMVLVNFNFESATDAASLAALIKSEEAQADSWLGATKGGANIREGKSMWSPEFDYAGRNPFKGEKRMGGAAPVMSCTLVEMRPRNVKIASGSARINGESTNVVEVQPLATIEKDAYLDNVVWVGCVGEDGYCLVEMKNALCTTGVNFQTVDKNVGTLPVEFAAHQDSPTFTEELPVRYLFYRNAAAAAQASETEQTEQEGTEE